MDIKEFLNKGDIFAAKAGAQLTMIGEGCADQCRQESQLQRVEDVGSKTNAMRVTEDIGDVLQGKT